VQREHTNCYGIASGTVVAEGLVDVSGIVDKPTHNVSPSTLAVAGRYILTPSIIQDLERISRGVGGISS
jgi:UTP--glucose-1-phosphate uridylyltransferase